MLIVKITVFYLQITQRLIPLPCICISLEQQSYICRSLSKQLISVYISKHEMTKYLKYLIYFYNYLKIFEN